jgi:hypothetical protein
VGKHNKAATLEEDRSPSRHDKLAYLGDMIKELSTISDALGCATLTGILLVASREAEIQSRQGPSAGFSMN